MANGDSQQIIKEEGQRKIIWENFPLLLSRKHIEQIYDVKRSKSIQIFNDPEMPIVKGPGRKKVYRDALRQLLEKQSGMISGE